MKNKKKKKKIPKGYDSRLEYDLHKHELKGWNYHPRERITYEVPSTYEPDFVTEINGKEILVEVKGRFRTRQEATKYIHVREALKQKPRTISPSKQKEKALIFLFQDADKPMPGAQRRKDGTKQTHGEWAGKNGFVYYCLKKGLPKQWLKDLI